MQPSRMVFAIALGFISSAAVDSDHAPALHAAEVRNVSPTAQHDEMRALISAVQRADYEDDRAALQRLFAQLVAYTAEPQLAPYARYWRGFAMWRRTINGFNDSVDPRELATD